MLIPRVHAFPLSAWSCAGLSLASVFRAVVRFRTLSVGHVVIRSRVHPLVAELSGGQMQLSIGVLVQPLAEPRSHAPFPRVRVVRPPLRFDQGLQ